MVFNYKFMSLLFGHLMLFVIGAAVLSLVTPLSADVLARLATGFLTGLLANMVIVYRNRH